VATVTPQAMTARQVVRKLLSLIAQVPVEKIDANDLSDDEYRRIVDAGKEISQLPIYVKGAG